MNTKTKPDNSKFTKNAGAYICVVCRKKTRETGDGESGSEMCKKCFIEAQEENARQDGKA